MVNAIASKSAPPEFLPGSQSKVRSFLVRARWLAEGDLRLDASYHADEAVRARHILEESGFQLKELQNPEVTQEIYYLPRFKRIYTTKPDLGYPFLSASETFMFRLPTNRWLARDKAPSPAERYFVKAGWILVSRSGSLGRCVLATKRMESFFLSDDLLRVIPVLPSGFVYAFLSTWIGQALMLREEYGGTISHLEPSHLARIPIPMIPEREQDFIHHLIQEAYSLRDEANALLDLADEILHSKLGLSRFDESKVSYFGDVFKPKTFVVKASELSERFDASYHLPEVRYVIEKLRDAKYPLNRLGNENVTERIFRPLRFRRTYVAPKYGLPFLQPSHIPLIKPYDIKYLSRRVNDRHIEECILKEGWVVLTRSGTVGRVLYVSEQLDGWVGSDDLIRILLRKDKYHPGFIAAFLMTPYGYYQVIREVYGGVIDHVEETHVSRVLFPDAPWPIQHDVGRLVVEAFNKKEKANLIEQDAISHLEQILKK